MHLLPYSPTTDLAALSTAPGWPHADTDAALGFAAGGAWTWLIVDDDDRVAGECGVKGPPDAQGAVEIGYGLAGPSRGRGLGGQAVTALLDELRRHPDVRTVDARVAADNLPSRRLLERRGFDLVDVDGTEVVYRLLV